jgi:hypothetical protein
MISGGASGIELTVMVAHTLLAGSLLDLGGGTDANETVVGLELLEGLGGVVDEGKAGALTATVLCAETEDGDLVLVGLVQVGQLLTELVLGDVGAVGVEDVPRFAKICQIDVFWLLIWFLCALCVFRLWLLLFFSFSRVCRPISICAHSICIFHHTQIPRGKIQGVLTRPSACGQAEGCG